MIGSRRLRAVATPQVVEAMHAALQPESVENWRRRFPGLIPEHFALAERLDQSTFELEGKRSSPSISGIPTPMIRAVFTYRRSALLIAGDAIYNGTHPYLVQSDHNGLNAWLAAIDKIEALKARAVVVGHGPSIPTTTRDISGKHAAIFRISSVSTLKPRRPRTLRSHARALSDRINPGSLWSSANAAKARMAAVSLSISLTRPAGKCSFPPPVSWRVLARRAQPIAGRPARLPGRYHQVGGKSRQ